MNLKKINCKRNTYKKKIFKWSFLEDGWYEFFLYGLRFHYIRDFKYYCKNRFFRKHHLINTRLKPGEWYDSDSRILHGMMQVLVEFVEKEVSLNIVDWQATLGAKKDYEEFMNIYNWWKNYPHRQQEIKDIEKKIRTIQDNIMSKTFLYKKWDFLDCPSTKETVSLYTLRDEMEDRLENEEQDMLIRLVNIRRALWT